VAGPATYPTATAQNGIRGTRVDVGSAADPGEALDEFGCVPGLAGVELSRRRYSQVNGGRPTTCTLLPNSSRRKR
jgi:hypothetical protein